MKTFMPFKIVNISTKHVDLTYTMINMAALREREEMLAEYLTTKNPDLSVVDDVLFDDYNATEILPNLKTCFYVDCIKAKPKAPKGAASLYLKDLMEQHLDNESIFCLYASPLSDIPIEKLWQVYERLGFKSVCGYPSVMYKYKE